MVNTDPVADMLSRIRNAIAVNKSSVNVPYSSLKERVAILLKEKGYIEDVIKQQVGNWTRLNIVLHKPGENSKISGIKRLSSPGRRLYAKSTTLPKSLSGRGIVVISTSRGLMTDQEARTQNVGGELLCEVY